MKKITFVFILIFSVITLGFAQSHKMSNGTIAANGSGSFYDDGGASANHSSNKSYTQTFEAPAGQHLTFTFSEFDLGVNDYLYVYDGAGTSARLINYYARTSNPGTITSTGQSLTFYFTSDNSSDGAGWAARYTSGSGPNEVETGGQDCANSNPFCTGTNYNFPNSTGQAGLGGGGIYGCLGSTPNPIWYYMQIGTSGNIHLQISQTSNGGSGIDVDFVCWGPFSSLAAGCGSLSSSNIVDCSYSTAAVENCDINGAVAGQVYIVLMTNYNGAAGHISFSQTNSGPNAGSTTCSILCSTVGNSGPVCTGNAFGLTATSVTGATDYHWTGPNGYSTSGASNQNPTGIVAPSTPGPQVYTLVVTTPTGTCTAQTTVTVKQTPVANAGTASVITCAQPNTLLDGSSNMPSASLTWTGPGGGADPYNASQAGTYTLTATASGCSSTATLAVTSNTTAPVASYTTPDGVSLTCTTQAVSLVGSANPPGSNISWSGPSGSIAGNPITASASGNYVVTATDPSNGCVGTATVSVSANSGTPNISVSSSPNNTTILSCRDSAIVLTGGTTTPNTVDGWVGPGGVGIIGNPITVTTPGQYTYSVTDNINGCQSSSSVNITLDTIPPAIQISAPNTIITCAQPSLALAGTSTTPSTTFAWSADSIPVAGNPINVTDSGTYILVVTNTVNGCTSTMSQVITKDVATPNASITASNTTLTCVVTSISLQGSSTTSGVTFAWDGPTGPTTNNPLITSTPGTYTLTVTNPTNGCTTTQTSTISESVNQPNVNYTVPQGTVIDCNTPTVILNGGSSLGTATLSWAGPSGNVPGNPATVGAAGTYTITATDPSNGCISVDSVAITAAGALPNISYTASAPNITCAISSVTLTGNSTTGGVTINWSSGGTSLGNPFTATTPGSYTLTVTDGTCTATSIASVGIDTLHPTVSILSPNTTITCASPSATLTGTSTGSAPSYSWNGPLGAIPGNPVSVNVAGTYSLTVTSVTNGCTRMQTVTLTTNTVQPTVNISSGTTVLTCATPSIQLTATGNPNNVNYAWSGLAVGANPVVNATSPGSYAVTVTDPSNGCSGNASVMLTQNTTTPGASAGIDAMQNCDGSAVPLNGSSPLSGVIFVWTGPGQFVDSNAVSAALTVGAYTLTVTNPANGCSGTDVMSVTTNTQVPNINGGLDQNIKCNKPKVVLNGSSSTLNAQFAWTGTDLSGHAISPAGANPFSAKDTVSVPGTYTLTVTNPATGCKATDIVHVVQTPGPNAVATATPVEGYAPLSVSFSSSGTTGSNNYHWNFDNGSFSNTANPTTTYTVGGTYHATLYASISGQCTDSITITIEVKEITQVVIPNIFSPNGDNINDLFEVTTKAVKDLTIDVWDRWGKHVTTFDGLKGHWDGTGSNDGTYFYVAKGIGTDNSEIEQTGFVLLVRAK